MSDETPPPKRSRRKLLLYTLGGVTAAAGATIGVTEWRERRVPPGAARRTAPRDGVLEPGAVVSARRVLGRTGIEVGVVGIGAGGLDRTSSPRLIERAVDHGMTYLDTATCYGESEDIIGRTLSDNKSLRDKLVLATKWDPGSRTTKAEMLASLDKSLRRMGTDRVDFMQVHWLGGGHMLNDNGLNRLDNPELYLAMEDAKKSGKVRFFGATSHHDKRASILTHAIDKGVFDLVLVKMNVIDHAEAGLPAMIARAKEKGVAVVAMKSQPGGGRLPEGYESSAYSVFQANVRWVLENGADCVVHSSIGVDEKSQDLAASAVGKRLGAADRALLERYAAAVSPLHCRGCGDACRRACPGEVQIEHVLHFDMYAHDYGWKDTARAHYAALPEAARWADACATCNLCTAACPHGVDAASRVRRARAALG